MTFKRFITVSALAGSLVSCNNDLEVMAPYRTIPVVYCILNSRQPDQFLRLERSFLGPENAYVMARHPDSIYYPGAVVTLERWADGAKKEASVLEPVDLPERDTGIFAQDRNFAYRSRMVIKPGNEYRLLISIPSTGAELTSVTHTVGTFKTIRPEEFTKNLSFYSYDNSQLVEWLSAKYARLYQLSLRFHYLEVRGVDTVSLSADWNLGYFLSKDGTGDERMKAEVLNRNFYKWIGNKLSDPGPNTERLADRKAVDYLFTVGGEELYTYLEVNSSSSSVVMERPAFTNVTNGLGIFSSRYFQSIEGKSLNPFSIDSLAYGIYTRHLRFADSDNDYYKR